MPKGEAILCEGRMELRRFPVHLSARIEAGPGDAAMASPHDLLMGYLLGENVSQLPVQLRAPVEQSAGDDWQLTEKAAPVRFDFPAGASIGHYPQPTDSRIQLQTVAERCLGTIWFGGEPSEGMIEEQAARLRKFIERKGFCELPSPGGRGPLTETFGPFAAFTRLSIPVSDWRPRGSMVSRRLAFRKRTATSSKVRKTL